MRVCYEAGPTGYDLYRQLTALGVDTTVILVQWASAARSCAYGLGVCLDPAIRGLCSSTSQMGIGQARRGSSQIGRLDRLG